MYIGLLCFDKHPPRLLLLLLLLRSSIAVLLLLLRYCFRLSMEGTGTYTDRGTTGCVLFSFPM